MKLIEIIFKRIKAIKVGLIVKALFRLAIRAKHLIRPELNYRKYYVKATPWLPSERKLPLLIPSSKFKFSLIPLAICLLVVFSFIALVARTNSRRTPKVQAFNPQLSPAPADSNYLYQNITNGYKVYLGDRLQETKPRVKFEEENSSAEFSLIKIPSQEAQLQNQDNKAAVYKNVWPGIDIKYSLTEKGVKEEIIISSRDSFAQLAKGQLEFNLNLKNAIPKKSLEGGTTGFFVEPTNGQYVFHIPQPFMTDAVGNRSEAVELKIDQQSTISNEGSQTLYTITLIPNQAWFQSAIYPVVIDPSVVHDESSEFTGTTNRIDDEGSGTAPKLRTPYHELPADIHTVGLWHMNNDWNDSSGNGNNGTANGGATFTTSSKLGSHAGTFDGSDDYVNVPNSSSLNFTKAITMEAWFKVDSVARDYPMIVEKEPTNQAWMFLINQVTGTWNGNISFRVYNGSTTVDVTASGLVTNRWYHIAGTNDGTISKIYIDGELKASAACSFSPVTGSNMVIGGEGTSYQWDGLIDEVRISNIARTAEEIKQDAQRFPYGVYTSDTIDLTSGTSTVASLDSLEWTDNVSTPGATLDGWPYFKPVIIDSVQIGNTLTNYQTRVQIDYDSNMQSDFDDLRFTSHTQTVSAYGDEATFNSASTEYIPVAKLDSTHFVVGYHDIGGDTYGHAKVGTVSGSTISYGSEYTFNSANTGYISVAALDSTHFVVGYWDSGGDYNGHAKVGTVSGSTISYGNEYTFNSADSRYISLAPLDSTHFVVGYKNNVGDAYGQAKIGTVSGSTISYGSEYTFNSATTNYISLAPLDSTHFIIGYEDYGGDKYGCAKIGTVSGTTISYGNEYCFNSATTEHLSVTALDSTHFVVGYWNWGGDYYGYAKVGTVSGSTISYGSAYLFNSATTYYISVTPLDSTHFVVGYQDFAGDSYGHAKVGTVSGSTISYGSESTFNSAATNHISVAPLDSTHFVVGYRDDGGDTYGQAKVGTVTNTNLDYWIETKSDGVEATAWVEVDTIPASSLTTIWMWYGNGGASAGSNADNTMVFYADFESCNIDDNSTCEGFTENSGTWRVVTGKELRENTNGDDTTYVSLGSESYWIEADLKTTRTDDHWGPGLIVNGMSAGSLSWRHVDDTEGSKIGRNLGAWNPTWYLVSWGTTFKNLDIVIVSAASGTIDLYYDNTLKYTYTATNTTGTKSLSLLGSDGASNYFDNIKVRKYTSPEPITGVGADIEFQTRTSSDGSTWEAWKPTTNETQIDSMDSVSLKPNEAISSGVCNEFTNFGGTNNSDISAVNGQKYFYTHYSGPATLYGQASANNFLECDGSSNGIYNSASTNYIANDVLDSSYGVVTYQDTGNSSQGTARIGSFLAGEDVSFPGSEYIFNNVATNYTSVAALDSTHFAVGYEDDGGDDYGCAQIGTTSSGTTISYGSEYCFNEAATQYVDFTMLDSTHFVAAYQDDGGSDYGCAKIGTVSGSTISYGSEYCFNNASTADISIDSLNSSHFVIAYQDTGNSSKGTAIIGTYSGSAVSYGSEYVFNDATTYYPSVSAFDSSRFVITYRDGGNSNYGTAIGGTVKYDSSISFTDEYVFNSNTTYYPSVAAMDDGSAYSVGFYNSSAYVYIKTGYINFNRSPIDRQTDTTIKMEGTASNEITVGAPQPDFDTRGLWHLEETNGDLAGDDVFDETSNDNDGEFNGSSIATAVADGIFGKARDFTSGSSDYIAIDDDTSLDFGTGDFSYELWVKPDAVPAGNQQILCKRDTSGGDMELQIGTDGKFYAYFGDSGGNVYCTSSTVISGKQWYHVAVTRKSGQGYLFVNDKMECTLLAEKNVNSANPLNLGRDVAGANEYLDGVIDEVKISSIARTSEEIYEAYRAGKDHRLQKTLSSTDLSGKTKVPFYFAADKQGTIAETYVGETDHAVYGVDSSTVALWHLDENHEGVDWEGYDSPGTVVDNASVGTLTWSNPSYAKVSDDSRASAGPVDSATVYSHYLKATNFGFNIPSSAKILGIRVGIEKYESCYGASCYVRDNEVKIVKGGSVGSTNKADTVTDWPGGSGSEAYTTYGGSTDLWGENWTPTDINASNFGVVLQAKIYDNSLFSTETAYVDHMRIDVWYATIKDESGNGNMAKSRGDVAWTSSGKIGGARYFDGSNDYLEVQDSSSLDLTTGMTLEAWVNFTGTFNATQNSVLEKAYWTSGADNGGYQLIVDNGTSGSAGCAVGNNDWDPLTSSSILTPNTWYHLACTFNGSTLKVYINGKEDNSVGTSVSSIKNISQTFNIGSVSAGTYNFQGMIDEARVSNTARTADEIRLAYQYGIRTHQITSDFVTTAGSDGPTSTSDLQFTPDTTTNLYKGDTVIVRENYNGTTYIMQGEVSSISSGLVTVASWSGIAPSGGYSTNADVFKWQREYWDLKDISPADRNTTVRLGMRILDASEGFTMYLDDFRHNTNYLTNNLGSTITSTANRYIQYRAILSTNNTEVTPELTSVTLDYNRAPTPPASLLTEGLTNPIDVTDLTPEFSAVYNDDDTWDIANKYWIQVDDDSAFGSTIWDSGASGTAMNNCVQGDRCQDISYAGSAPTPDTKYYWRIKYWDDQGAEGDWSTETAYFTVALAPPANCVIEDGNQPDELTVRWDDMSSNETGFRIEKNIDAAGFNYLTDKAADSTSHLDNTTSANHTYQYRIRAESGSTYSLWCTTSTVDLSTAEGANEGFRFEGVRMEGLKIE